MYPKNENPEDSNYLSIFLCNLTNFDITAGYQFSILDANKTTKNHCPKDEAVSFRLFKAAYQENANDSWGYTKFVKFTSLHANSSQLMPQNTLTILCDIIIVGKMKPVLLTNDCENFSQKMKDLSTRFSVFRGMLQAGLADEEKSLAPNVLEEMLNFVHTGEILKLDEHARELMAAADKYELPELKTMCEDNLCEKLSVENCVEFLVISYIYKAEDLKRLSLNLFANNRERIIKSRDWKETLKNHPDLMLEVIEALG